MATTGNSRFNEELANYYLDNFIPLADQIHRLAFAIILNLENAKKCVLDSFQDIASDLELIVSENGNPRLILVKKCWHYCQKFRKSDTKIGQSKMAKALKQLSLEHRGVVAMVDLIGISVQDAADSIGFDEKKFREYLAAAREKLIANSTDL